MYHNQNYSKIPQEIKKSKQVTRIITHIFFFYQILLCKSVRKTPKKHQEIMEKYFGIFAKDFDTQEVQEAKSRGVTSKK
jgi:hypothetical protein